MKFPPYLLIILCFVAFLLLPACGQDNNAIQEGETPEEIKADESDASAALEDEVGPEVAEDESAEEMNAPEESKNLPDNAQSTEGTVVTIEEGDYFYLIVRTEAEDFSFMVFETDETFEKIFEDPSAYEGKKIRVQWEATQQNIPEAGGEIAIKKYLRSEIIE